MEHMNRALLVSSIHKVLNAYDLSSIYSDRLLHIQMFIRYIHGISRFMLSVILNRLRILKENSVGAFHEAGSRYDAHARFIKLLEGMRPSESHVLESLCKLMVNAFIGDEGRGYLLSEQLIHTIENDADVFLVLPYKDSYATSNGIHISDRFKVYLYVKMVHGSPSVPLTPCQSIPNDVHLSIRMGRHGEENRKALSGDRYNDIQWDNCHVFDNMGMRACVALYMADAPFSHVADISYYDTIRATTIFYGNKKKLCFMNNINMDIIRYCMNRYIQKVGEEHPHAEVLDYIIKNLSLDERSFLFSSMRATLRKLVSFYEHIHIPYSDAFVEDGEVKISGLDEFISLYSRLKSLRYEFP